MLRDLNVIRVIIPRCGLPIANGARPHGVAVVFHVVALPFRRRFEMKGIPRAHCIVFVAIRERDDLDLGGNLHLPTGQITS